MDNIIEMIENLTDAQLSEYSKNLMVGGGVPGPMPVRGEGIRLFDRNGKSYIDCTSQSWAMYLGHANQEINHTACEQMQKMSHIHQGIPTAERLALVHKLAEIAPKNLNRVSFTFGGGPAVEAAMKIAYKNISNAKNFVVLWNSFHGMTLGSAGAGWNVTKSTGSFTGQVNFLQGLNTNFVRVPNPYCYRCYFGDKPDSCGKCGLMCAEMLRLTLQKGVIGQAAGVIVEPIQGSGGQIPMPKAYLQRVREICDEFGTLLIYDEIQTYCRIGEFFAAKYYDVEPDIIVIGKALGGGLPLAGVIIHDKLKGFEPRSEEQHTFANNSVAQVCALKLIDIVERDNILENTATVGDYLGDKLKAMMDKYPEIGDVRQIGLHIGVELVEDASTKKPISHDTLMKIRKAAIENGMILGTGGAITNLLKFKPPLIVTKEDADEMIDIFDKAMKTVLR